MHQFESTDPLLAIRTFVNSPVYDRMTDILFFSSFFQPITLQFCSWELAVMLLIGWKNRKMLDFPLYHLTTVQLYDGVTEANLMWALLLWQYGLWSFQTGYTKLERFLPKNQHANRIFLNFENWTNLGSQKFAKTRVFKVDYFDFLCKILSTYIKTSQLFLLKADNNRHILTLPICWGLNSMAILVVEFSNGVYKIRKIFA